MSFTQKPCHVYRDGLHAGNGKIGNAEARYSGHASLSIALEGNTLTVLVLRCMIDAPEQCAFDAAFAQNCNESFGCRRICIVVCSERRDAYSSQLPMVKGISRKSEANKLIL